MRVLRQCRGGSRARSAGAPGRAASGRGRGRRIRVTRRIFRTNGRPLDRGGRRRGRGRRTCRDGKVATRWTCRWGSVATRPGRGRGHRTSRGSVATRPGRGRRRVATRRRRIADPGRPLVRGHAATSADAARLEAIRGARSIARAFGLAHTSRARGARRSCRRRSRPAQRGTPRIRRRSGGRLGLR